MGYISIFMRVISYYSIIDYNDEILLITPEKTKYTQICGFVTFHQICLDFG